MEIIQKQVALFLRTQFERPFEELVLKIKTRAGEANTQYIPLPPNVPPEIPRVILSYVASGININLSKNRVDIFFKDLNNIQTLLSSMWECLSIQFFLHHVIGFRFRRFMDF